jgi:hypothetical protein
MDDFQPRHPFSILVAARLIKPLGNPPQNGSKYFASVDIVELARDRTWLAKMSNAITQHWHRQNARRRVPSGEIESGMPEGLAVPSGGNGDRR